MSVTFLDLTNRTLRRLNEVQLTTGTFSAAEGFQAQAKEAVNDAINDILNSELQWPFLRADGTITTAAGTDDYALPADYRVIDWGSFYIDADTDISAAKLQNIDLEAYRDNLLEQAKNATTSAGYGKPQYVFNTKQVSIGIWQKPDQVYTIRYTYWQKSTDMDVTDPTAVTLVPDRYANVIIAGAMYYCYMFRDNIEMTDRAEKRFAKGITQMRTDLINRTQSMRSDQIPTRVRSGAAYTG